MWQQYYILGYIIAAKFYPMGQILGGTIIVMTVLMADFIMAETHQPNIVIILIIYSV